MHSLELFHGAFEVGDFGNRTGIVMALGGTAIVLDTLRARVLSLPRLNRRRRITQLLRL
jgi:hypothetical protein